MFDRIFIYLCVLVWITSISKICNAGEYRAGFGKRDITPRVGKDLVPTIEGGEKLVTAIQDPLFVKTLVLEDGNKRIAIISLDLIRLPTSILQQVSDQLTRTHSLDHLLFTVTHTHSGAITPNNFWTLKRAIYTSMNSARSRMETVTIGATQGHVDEAYNRIVRKGNNAEMLWSNPNRIKNGDVDNAIGIIHIESKSTGDTIVSLVNYHAHPVITMDLNEVVVSADYPGELAKALKHKIGGESMFLLGAAGDVNPYHADTNPIALAIEKSRELGEALANEVSTQIESIDNYQTQGEFIIKNKHFNKPDANISVVVLSQDIALASFPGEYFNEFGTRLKTNSPFKNTFFIGFCNGYIGYVPTEKATTIGGYGAELDKLQVKKDTGKKHVQYALKSLKKIHKTMKKYNVE